MSTLATRSLRLQALATLVAAAFAAGVSAQTAAPAAPTAKTTAKTTAKAPAKSARKAPAAPAEPAVPDAQPDQVKAAELVYYGKYDCEFDQSIHIQQSPKHSAYVDVKAGKSGWLMKPVLSSTGAIRLEDVKGETLMVQIASKSMLLNVKTAKRIVDDCVSPRQRELIEEAKVAKAAAEAAAVKVAAEAAAAPAASAAPADPAAPAAPASR